jgi:hypothetical protein
VRAAWVTTFLTAAVLAGPLAPTSASAALPKTVIGLLGDVPYGSTQEKAFPSLISKVNNTSGISLVLHAGDTKSGNQRCDDSVYPQRAAWFNQFADPFVITPGDNDWSDCHVAAAGSYLPTGAPDARLETLRRAWYPSPGQTLGAGSVPGIVSQASVTPPSGHSNNRNYIENVRFTLGSGVVLATLHIVGGNNDLRAWSGLVGGDQPTIRQAEFAARRTANLDWIDAAFAAAANQKGLILLMQAEPTTNSGFSQERARILAKAKAYKKPVLLVHGDEHKYEVQKNYGGVANLTRLETYGATTANWLKVTVDPNKTGMAIFSWVTMAGV